MSKPWSKLQKQFYLLRADALDLQLQCRVYRMDSQRGSTGIPRYWISLGKNIIWDYPKDFVGKNHPKRADVKHYPYGNDMAEISNLIRDYIDTPKNELMSKAFANDHWGLINILRAADKRIGTGRLKLLKKKTNNKAALTLIDARLARKENKDVGHV